MVPDLHLLTSASQACGHAELDAGKATWDTGLPGQVREKTRIRWICSKPTREDRINVIKQERPAEKMNVRTSV